MKLNSKSLSLSKLTPNVLIFTHDNFTLTGALAKRGNGEIVAQAESRSLDLDLALEEVLQALRNEGYRLPRRAVMGVTYAVSGLFELPVDPKKPRPDKQMQELVRYELDAQLGEFNDIWSVPAIMQGRGYIDQQQRETTLLRLKEKRASGNAGLVRFGDVAVDLGFINVPQRDEVMDLQSDIATTDEMLHCGWRPQVLAKEDAEPLKVWYGAGINRLKRNLWARRFRNEGITLTQLYPIEGLGMVAAASLLEEGQAALVFNISAEQVHCYRLEKDSWDRPQITAMTSEHLDGRFELDSVGEIGLAMLQPSVEKICCLMDDCRYAQHESLLEQLSARLDKPAEVLVDSGGARLHPLTLLARASNQQSKEHFMVSIAAQDPGPPLWKDVNFLRYAVPAAIVLAMITNEAFTRYKVWSLNTELAAMREDTSKKSQVNKEMTAVLNEAQLDEKRIGQLELELDELRQAIKAGKLFANRATLAHDILVVLEQSVNTEVMLESFAEPPRSKNPGFHLKAWAVSESAATRFVSKLKRNMRDVAHKVVTEQNQADKNRYGMSGHSIDLWLVPDTSRATAKN